MKSTIIDKVYIILKKHGSLTLKEIYDLLPEHTPSSIRGNINRHIKNATKKVLARCKKATYIACDYIESTSNSISTNSKVLNLEKIKQIKLMKSVSKSKAFDLKMVSGIDGQISIFNNDMDIIDTTYDCYETTSAVATSSLENNDGAKSLFNISNMLNKIMNMDAIQFLKSLPDKTVDLLITDPPYPVISGGTSDKKGTPSGILSKNDGKIFDFNNIKIEDWVPEVYRVMKDNTQGYIMTNLLNLEKLMKVCQDVGFKIHNLLVWKKNNATPNRWFMKNCEYTLFIRKGKAKPIVNKGSMTVHEFDNIIGNKLHPTEKPLSLINYYLQNSVVPNGVLLDPFCGLGATPVSAILNKMNFLATEIDTKYFKLAKQRIQNTFRLGYDDRSLLFNY